MPYCSLCTKFVPSCALFLSFCCLRVVDLTIKWALSSNSLCSAVVVVMRSYFLFFSHNLDSVACYMMRVSEFYLSFTVHHHTVIKVTDPELQTLWNLTFSVSFLHQKRRKGLNWRDGAFQQAIIKGFGNSNRIMRWLSFQTCFVLQAWYLRSSPHGVCLTVTNQSGIHLSAVGRKTQAAGHTH